MFLSVVSLLVVLAAFFLQPFGNTVVLLVLNGVGFLMIGGALYLYKKRKRVIFAEAFPRIVPAKKKAPVIPVASKKAAN
jgi:LPXTG-motif cell wall-anchored protein